MNKAKKCIFASFIVISILLTSCGLTTDLKDIYSSPLPNLENTDGDAGGTGGSNPPPPGD